MKTSFKTIALIGAIYILSSCASQPVDRPPSEYLLTTDKSASVLFKDLRAKFTEHKYVIKKDDEAAGLMVFAPRRFSFDKSGKKIIAQQKVNLRQEGGSLKLRISYECNYSSDNKTFSPCFIGDESQAKIGRIEPALVEMIRPILMKHADTSDGSVFDDTKKDSGGW